MLSAHKENTLLRLCYRIFAGLHAKYSVINNKKRTKKHRHAPNTACPPFTPVLYPPPIQPTNTPPPYFHLPRRAFPPTPSFFVPCFLFTNSLFKPSIRQTPPGVCPCSAGLFHPRPLFCALFSLHKQPIQSSIHQAHLVRLPRQGLLKLGKYTPLITLHPIHPPNATRRLPLPRRAFPHRNPPISTLAFSATTFHRLYLDIIK